jgi:hypothetical protein
MDFITGILALAFLLFISLVVGAIFRSEVLHVDVDGEGRGKAVFLSVIVGIAVLALICWIGSGFE